ncbi:hypothetical protein [Salidesulfovibrio onnuriiensis]|uniref:hypothetical protein n=1 Tax=Salidesulfovibrio onnuriiensis TaxID=2583823 RepID=UPI0011C8766B|nr:hypothetical protein [Salidesulfovibrio onnuriiensis]
MKISRLYLKILGTFLLVQVAAILAMFILLHYDKIRPPFALHAEERTVAIKRLVSNALEGHGRLDQALENRLSTMLTIFASAFQGEAWITDGQGQILVSSFHGPIPMTGEESVEKEIPTKGGIPCILSRKAT